MCVNESSEFTTSHKQPDHIRPHFCNLVISAPANGEAAFTVQRSLVRTVEQPLLSALRGSSRAASTPAVKQPLLQSQCYCKVGTSQLFRDSSSIATPKLPP